jgi:hypothetical protein
MIGSRVRVRDANYYISIAFFLLQQLASNQQLRLG